MSFCFQIMRHVSPDIDKPVYIFDFKVKVIEHINNHILTAPESQSWKIIFPEYRKLLENHDEADTRYQIAKQIIDDDESCQYFYNLYAREIRCNANDAALLGWYAKEPDIKNQEKIGSSFIDQEDNNPVCAFGTSGIYMVIEKDRIITAFIPGMGVPILTETTTEINKKNPIPRERSKKTYTYKRKIKRKTKGRENWEKSLTPDMRLFYFVFRPAYQTVRTKNLHTSDQERVNKTDFSTLKKGLLKNKITSYEQWKKVRERHGYMQGE